MRSTFIRIAAISLGSWWIVLPVLSSVQPDSSRKKSRLSHYFESPAQQSPKGSGSKNLLVAQNEWQSEMQPSHPVSEQTPQREEVISTEQERNTIKADAAQSAVRTNKDGAVKPPSQGAAD